jgi:glutathione S-transferase
MALTFYYGSGSPFAWRVWLALEHKGIAYDFKLLSFDKKENKTPAFLAVNPRGQVPAIVDDGFALWESAAILEYLEEAYPQQPLLPKDKRGRATVRRLAREADNQLADAVNGLTEETLFRPADKQEPAKIAEAQQAALGELARWETQLTGDYLAGALSLADFTAYPFVRTLRRIGERQPNNRMDDRLPPKVSAWLKRIEALPYYAKTIPPHWKG